MLHFQMYRHFIVLAAFATLFAIATAQPRDFGDGAYDFGKHAYDDIPHLT